MFAGVSSILLNEDNTVITGIASREGEEVRVKKILKHREILFRTRYICIPAIVNILIC